jgi:dolichol-phosphate mannosyltransferase
MTHEMSPQPGSDYLLSVIVPVFNEEAVLSDFLERIQAVLEKLECRYELIFINDGSRDRTLEIIKEAKRKKPHIKVLSLSRNFGHQSAITAGMDHAKGDAVIIIDADLQDPPELIPQLVKKWRQGYDIVDAQRKRRLGETIFKTWSAALFYRLLQKLSNVRIPVDVGDYRLLSRNVVTELNRLRESHRYVRGLVAWLGFSRTAVEYVRDKRYAGKTKYPLVKMLRFSIDGITAFSIVPLRIATYLGFTIAALSFLYIPYAFYVKFVARTTVTGWTTVIVAIFFLGGIQLFCMGILGEYIGIIHEESKKRPLYIIREIDAD